MSLLDEVEEWKLEAKLENNSRYFYHVNVVDKLSNGKKQYVIGRKGTGKTAICEYLVSNKASDTFSQKLTFKNFPFNMLYDLKDEGFTAPNRYITVWKYLIYSSVCKLMANDESINAEIRIQLRDIFGDRDINKALNSTVSHWTSAKFDFKIFGSGLGGGVDRKQADSAEKTSLPERVEILETFLSTNLGNNKYLIVFDELDEDYKNIMLPENYDRYRELLTGLFKAAQDIRYIFSSNKFYPIIFLRDDIYDLLDDPDKTKWSDLMYELDWSSDDIRRLLAFRISRALDRNGKTLSFYNAWRSLFTKSPVSYGHKQQKTMSVFDYITRSSQGRPRDYVKYLQLCAEKANANHANLITSSDVLTQDKAFSNYLRNELQDEIHGAIPEIKQIFNLLTKIRLQTISTETFKAAYEAEIISTGLIRRDPLFVLEMLFTFSVIGNQPKQKNFQVFRYQNKEARFNHSEPIIIHRGLYKALQII